MNRFREPCLGDEYRLCQFCGRRFLYSELDEFGHCSTCRPSIIVLEDNTESRSDPEDSTPSCDE